MLDACLPKSRLPDPGLALEHECSGPCLRFADKGVNRSEFLVPPHDLDQHAPRNDGDRGRDESNLTSNAGGRKPFMERLICNRWPFMEPCAALSEFRSRSATPPRAVPPVGLNPEQRGEQRDDRVHPDEPV